MKKATLLLYVLLLSISSFLLTKKFDVDDSRKYFLFEPNLRLQISELDGMSENALNDIMNNMSEGTYLKKTFFRSGYNATFINFNSYAELSSYLNSIGIKNSLGNNCSALCFIATYESGDEMQGGLARDFMGNHSYRFYLMKDMVASGYALFGDYDILSSDKLTDETYIKTLLDSGDIKGELSNYTAPIFSSIVGVLEQQVNSFILIIIVIFISTTIYDYYKNARRIAILKMLGYSNQAIFSEMGFSNLILIIGTQITVLLVILMTVSGVSWFFLQTLVVFYAGILLLYLMISYLVMLVMNQKLSISSALRKQSLTSTLVSLSMIVKLGIGVLLLTSSFTSFTRIEKTYRDYKEGLKYESIFSITRFNGFIRNETDDAEFSRRSLRFYSNLATQDAIDYVLANFIEFYPLTNPEVYYEGIDRESMENDLRNYQNGLNIPMGEVDRNYLKKFEVKAFSEDGKLLDLESTLYEYSILIPESKKGNTEAIKAFSETYSRPASFQKSMAVAYPIVYYYYEDQKLPSLDPKVAPDLYIESPVLYVMDTPTMLDFEEGGTLILGGDSALKFFPHEFESKPDLYQKILPYLLANDLQEFVDLSLFVSYGDEYGQVSNLALIGIANDAMFLMVVLMVYLMISMQMNKLQFESDLQDIAVKKYLGYKNLDSYANLILLNAAVLVMTFIASLVIYMLTQGIVSIRFIIPVASITLIDGMGVALFVWYLKKKNLAGVLKGEN